jgi:tetratricopeptide (TPR) repeat protein
LTPAFFTTIWRETLFSQDQIKLLDSSFQRGLILGEPTAERLEKIEMASRNRLANLSILGLPLDFDGIKNFLEQSGDTLSVDEYMAWLDSCLETNLFLKIIGADDNMSLWRLHDVVSDYFIKNAQTEDLKRYHRNADGFILERISSLAMSMNIILPDGDARRDAILGANNFLYQISHLPQHQEFHQSILNLAINWFDHLFWLGEYKEAADILNSICFALARRGQRKMAENMLAAIASKTKGLTSVVAQMNLATLLREELQLSLAIRLYWQLIPKLSKLKAFIQLAQILSEMAAIYRQMGNLRRSAMILELSVILNRWLKNWKSLAIARSQLSSTYRYLKYYSLALRNSKKAVNYFRKTNDLLNLGRSLLTQGNIHYNKSKSDSALLCFNESLEIGKRIEDHQTEIGSTSGKARVFLSLKKYDEAQTLLEQAISLRERYNDHYIGIEYQNMGALHEQKGDYAMALGWYQKALVQFEKYMPVEVAACRWNIAQVQAKYRG